MRNQKSGFTLIEMLIVVVIIGILAAALIPRLQSVQERARDAARKDQLQQIGSALAVYKHDNSSYSGANLTTALVPGYLSSLPTDPNTATPSVLSGFNIGTTLTSGQTVGGFGLHIYCNNAACIILGANTEAVGSSSNATFSGDTTPGVFGSRPNLLGSTSTINSGQNLITAAMIPTTTTPANRRYYYIQ